MVKAVYDTNLLVSAFLTRDNPEGVSRELLRLVKEGSVELYLSAEIVAETLATLVSSERARHRYNYTSRMAIQYCAALLAAPMIIIDPPPITGAVARDPDDDKIIACAAAVGAEYLVSRDRDLLTLGSYREIKIVTPEMLLRIVRSLSPSS
jgi:putative PIN family toxin of toxin-antitoxin system